MSQDQKDALHPAYVKMGAAPAAPAAPADPFPVNRTPGWDAPSKQHSQILEQLKKLLNPILTPEQYQQFGAYGQALHAAVLTILRYPPSAMSPHPLWDQAATAVPEKADYRKIRDEYAASWAAHNAPAPAVPQQQARPDELHAIIAEVVQEVADDPVCDCDGGAYLRPSFVALIHRLRDAAANLAAPAVQVIDAPRVEDDELAKIHAFLLGEGQIGGLSFGDVNTEKPRSRYWWREYLSRAIARQAQPIDRDAVSVLREMIEETDLTYKRGILHDAIRRIEARQAGGSTTEGAA